MKIAAITKFKHGTLYQLLEELEWSQAELSRRSGVSYSMINEIMRLTRRPTDEQVARIEAALGKAGKIIDVGSLFPDSYIGFKRSLRVVQVQDIEPHQLEDLRQHQTRLLEDAQPPLPEDMLDTEEKLAQIATLLDGTKHCLTDREREIIRLRIFEEKQCGEIAERYGITGQAINHTFHYALQKIRDYFRMQDRREEFDERFRGMPCLDTIKEAAARGEEITTAEKWNENLEDRPEVSLDSDHWYSLGEIRHKVP